MWSDVKRVCCVERMFHVLKPRAAFLTVILIISLFARGGTSKISHLLNISKNPEKRSFHLDFLCSQTSCGLFSFQLKKYFKKIFFFRLINKSHEHISDFLMNIRLITKYKSANKYYEQVQRTQWRQLPVCQVKQWLMTWCTGNIISQKSWVPPPPHPVPPPPSCAATFKHLWRPPKGLFYYMRAWLHKTFTKWGFIYLFIFSFGGGCYMAPSPLSADISLNHCCRLLSASLAELEIDSELCFNKHWPTNPEMKI